MAEKFTRWDILDHLKTEKDIALYLEAALEEAGDDPKFLATVLGDIARARNVSQLAKDIGMSREGLYKAVSGKGNPSFDTVHRIAKGLGLRLTFVPANDHDAKKPTRMNV